MGDWVSTADLKPGDRVTVTRRPAVVILAVETLGGWVVRTNRGEVECPSDFQWETLGPDD